MRLSTKGQVTIPQEIREQLGLLPGMELDFEVHGEEIRVRRTRGSKTRGQLIVENMRRHRGEGTMTTDEIMALTRGEDWRDPNPR
jgi:AbrB family looped-hinge helix DNA binding protein